MKAGLLVVALSALAAAQPHIKHAKFHEEKRDVVVDTATAVDVVTATAAATVYVDQNGHAVEATPSPAASPAAPKANNNAAEKQPHHDHSSSAAAPAPAAPTTTTAAAPVAPAPQSQAPPASSAAPAPASSSPASSGGSSAPATNGLGITYSPYLASGCKSTEQVAKDINALNGYSSIRIYGTDCNQVANVMAAAVPKGMKVLIGIFDITPANLQAEVDLINKGVNGAWSSVEAISVGNEGVNDNTYTVAAVTTAISSAKGMLSKYGYNGPVVTVDTFIAVINNPAMCDLSDTIYVNCHAFFDGNVAAGDAGTFVLQQAQRVSSTCKGKSVVITESGWPSQGSANNKAIPGQSQQSDAIKSLSSKFTSNMYLFTAYNDPEKAPGQFGVEPYWGIHGNAPSI